MSGIYFLVWHKKVIYIGQSTNLAMRLLEHKHVRFNRIHIIECMPEKLIEYERRLIKFFKPKYNTHHTGKSFMERKYLPYQQGINRLAKLVKS